MDIGCGSGRISVELARRGAYVVGVDYSRNMLNLANRLAQKYGVADKCAFILDDFLTHTFRTMFGVSIALGFFDYTENPFPYLRRMRLLTKEKCIMSFPPKFTVQTPIRKVWLMKRMLPVFFYTKGEVRNLLSRCFPDFTITALSADYFCVGHCCAQRKISDVHRLAGIPFPTTRRCGEYTLKAMEHILENFDCKKMPIQDMLREYAV